MKSDYALGPRQMFQACMEREMLLVGRNLALYVVRFTQLLVMAIVTATLFARGRMTPTSVTEGSLYFGGEISLVNKA